jgi:hypothetical protein
MGNLRGLQRPTHDPTGAQAGLGATQNRSADTQAARESARAFTQADGLAEARSAARMATRVALADQGVPWRGDELRVDCDGSCLAPGSSIRVSVSTRVRLPFLPDSMADSTVGAVPVSAVHLAVIDDYRDAP